MAQKIYLAGPDVFLPPAKEVGKRKPKEVGELKQALCLEFGFEGLVPVDKKDEVAENAAQIFEYNCHLMRTADLGLFNLSPFRGPSADAGTVFELGFMYALGKPVHGYSSSTDKYAVRVRGAGDPLVERDHRLWAADGYSVEPFGLEDNLMILKAIAVNGGVFKTVPEQSLAAFQAFRECLEALRARVLGKV